MGKSVERQIFLENFEHENNEISDSSTFRVSTLLTRFEYYSSSFTYEFGRVK
jgi:hypothetical protein